MDYNEVKEKKSIPIGRPLKNSEIYLLDEEETIIEETGVTGEIYVTGPGIASGYYNDLKNTNKVFVSLQLEGMEQRYYYRTGDLAQWDENGRLQFVGRQDDQIKHMGHRIELGEIETAAMEIASVKEACCLFIKGKIVLCVAGETDKAYITGQLREKLADYMMPKRIEVLEEIPKNKNGKKDKLRLEQLVGERKRWKK